MDPFSAILLIGIMTVATVKTAGTAATDGIAQAKGQTPPSQERWRANQEKKRQRGEQPRDDPGGLRRIWQQHTEAAAEKSAHKHRGTMDYLRDHGDAIATRKKNALERSARRREYLGGTLAQAGGASWQALKTAAQKAAEAKRNHDNRKSEKDAWRENAWRDEEEARNRNNYRRQDGEPSATDTAPDQDERPDAEVLTFPPRREGTDSTGEETGADSASTDDADGENENSQPAANEDESAAQKGGDTTENAEHGTGTDPEKDMIGDPDRVTGEISIADLQRRRAREEEDRRRTEKAEERAHDAAEAQADRDHAERLAQIQAQQPANTDTSEGDAMSTSQSGNTEITDLTTAQMRAKESQQYAGKVTAVLSDQSDSIQAAIAGMQAEAQMQESGSGSLAGEGFNSRITGRFDSGAEAFHNAIAALQQQVQALQTSMEQVDTARAEMKNAATFFDRQQGLADQIGAEQQQGGVSKRTDFYAQSGA